MSSHDGRFVSITAGRNLWSGAQPVAIGGPGRTGAARQPRRSVEWGFIEAADPTADIEVHQLQSRSARPEGLDASRRILLVESDPVLAEFLTILLEDEGYTIVAAGAPADAVAILSGSGFDLVITDGFSETTDAVLVSTAELLEAAGATPVVLLTAHRPDPHAVRASGFRDLIEKPFDVGPFEDRIRGLFPSSSHRAAGDRFAENAGA